MRRAVLFALATALATSGCGGGDDDQPSREEARRCLERMGLRVMEVEPAAGDTDAPDAQLIANDSRAGRVMVFAGYYDDEGRAERFEPSLRRNARRFDGVVERHGPLTLLWVRGRESPTGERARDCLV